MGKNEDGATALADAPGKTVTIIASSDVEKLIKQRSNVDVDRALGESFSKPGGELDIPVIPGRFKEVTVPNRSQPVSIPMTINDGVNFWYTWADKAALESQYPFNLQTQCFVVSRSNDAGKEVPDVYFRGQDNVQRGNMFLVAFTKKFITEMRDFHRNQAIQGISARAELPSIADENNSIVFDPINKLD